jgi:hypothetical protein
MPFLKGAVLAITFTVLFNGSAIAQNLSQPRLICGITKTSEPEVAQKKSEATIGLSYYKKSDGTRTAVAIVKAKNTEHKFAPVKNVKVAFYSVHEKELTLIQAATSNVKGEATLVIGKGLPLEEDRSFTVVAKIENDPLYQDAEEKIQMRDVNLSLALNPADTAQRATAKVTQSDKDGNLVPLKGVELKFYVQRLFGYMPGGDSYTVTTDDKGEASFAYPKKIAGNEAGLITVMVRTEDNDQFGNVEASTSVKWGTVLAVDQNPFPRALWEPYAPLPLVLTICILFGGVWSTYAYIFIQLRKIKTEKITA